MKVVFVRSASSVRRRGRSSIALCSERSGCREVNLRDLEALVILGSEVSIESGAIALLSSFNVPVAVLSRLGTSILSVPVITLYNEVRRRQYSMDDEERAEVMLRILNAKFRGLANVLRYYGVPPPEISEPAGDLLTWEAATSRSFWDELVELIPPGLLAELRLRYGFEGRRPRAPDPFNKSVSLLYSILYALCLRALLASGLDPTLGLHHKTRYSVPLVYDYSEMFKPAAVHAVLKVYRAGARLELGEDGELTRESVRAVAEEFFRLLRARVAGTRYTVRRLIYVNAFRLADRIRGNVGASYTFTYNPKKLRLPREE